MNKCTTDRNTRKSRILKSVLLLLILTAVPMFAEFIELGAGGTLLMNVPFCGG
jgi:hypothetical protein